MARTIRKVRAFSIGERHGKVREEQSQRQGKNSRESMETNSGNI